MSVGINTDAANIPSVNLVVQGSDPAAPGSGHAQLYVKGSALYLLLDSGDPILVGFVVALAEGRLAVGDASDELTALALGTEGQLVTADANGMAAWADAPSGAGYTEGARVRRTTDQTITTATSTPIVFDSETFDTDTIWEGVTNPSRLTCQTAGKYLITGSLYWAGAATGQRHIYIMVNGTTQIAGEVLVANAAGQGASVSALYSLAQGDYVQLIVYHDRGSNLAVTAYADWSPSFSMARVG